MTKRIRETAEDFNHGRMLLNVVSNPDAPAFIETYEDIARGEAGILRLTKSFGDEYGAIVIACHYDPGLDALKERCPCPVFGIGEASFRTAAMLGYRFSLLTTDRHSIPLHEQLIHKYGLQHLCASIRAPQPEEQTLPDEEKYKILAQRSFVQDGAEVLVLGCAGLGGLDKYLQHQFNRPVLDGIACALALAEGSSGLISLHKRPAKGHHHDCKEQ
jgi:allantoin racemase